MRIVFAVTIMVFAIIACSKTEAIMEERSQLPVPEAVYPLYTGTNPILGRWYIGRYSRVCGNDSTVYENNNGNYVDFRDNDTMYVTYVTDGSFGWGPYQMIDSNVVVLYGEVYQIQSIDKDQFTVHYEIKEAAIKQTITYLKNRE